MQTTLTINSRGVVTLPAKLRRALGLKADDQLIAETTPEGLLLRPAVTLPVEIYSEKRIREFDEAEAELAKVLSRRRPRRKAAGGSAADASLPRREYPLFRSEVRWRGEGASDADGASRARMPG